MLTCEPVVLPDWAWRARALTSKRRKPRMPLSIARRFDGRDWFAISRQMPDVKLLLERFDHFRRAIGLQIRCHQPQRDPYYIPMMQLRSESFTQFEPELMRQFDV